MLWHAIYYWEYHVLDNKKIEAQYSCALVKVMEMCYLYVLLEGYSATSERFEQVLGLWNGSHQY